MGIQKGAFGAQEKVPQQELILGQVGVLGYQLQHELAR